MEALLAIVIAHRTAAGLSLRAYGAEGYTQAQPYTAHAKDAAQFQRWVWALQGRGYTVEAINP